MEKVLIANRGEIALRIMKTAKRLGLSIVAVCSEADKDSLAVQFADEVVVLGPAPASQSYLDQDAVLAAAIDSGADAIHPGFGFLAENAEFARKVQEAGLTWVGPAPEVIALMGDKIAALEAAEAAGVPVLAGSKGRAVEENLDKIASEIGFPLVVKASAGGGGRGIRIVEKPEELADTLAQAQSEAQASFGDSTVYLERFVPKARHVEVQILGDGTQVIHLGDRDCTFQRRSQKVLEEAPAPNLPEHVRKQIRETSVQLAKNCQYSGVGTVEFLYDPEREEAAFIEMNTRLQVEHPVTEMITGLDLVEQQLRIAAGESLNLKQDDITFNGHAFECRINAENPAMNFFPSPGTLEKVVWPQQDYVRIDSGVDQGCTIQPFYDSMVAKLIVHGTDRQTALAHLRQALEDTTIEGISCTLDLHRALVQTTAIDEVSHYTTMIEKQPEIWQMPAK